MNNIYGAERAGRRPIQQYHPPRKVPQGIARRAPDANALPIPEQTANVAYAPSMPLAGDGDDIVTSALITPDREKGIQFSGKGTASKHTPQVQKHAQ